MTVEVEFPGRSASVPSRLPEHTAPRIGSGGAGPAPLVIGLINNMPDSAVEGTETQFSSLLAAGSDSVHVRLRFATLPGVPRSPALASRIADRYWDIRDVYDDPPDALIVTGTEPRAANLADEPYWDALVRLMEFSRTGVCSSAWSCLAAHAAVQHFDGIHRRRLSVKRCGVYEHTLTSGHALTIGLDAPLRTPHSRWNDLPLHALVKAGYGILSQSHETGADAFVRTEDNLMLFFQGHPEYEGRTLLKEFQRDVGRFVAGTYTTYPTVPAGYFNADACKLLTDFETQLKAGKHSDPLAAFPFSAVAASLRNTWSQSAARIYSNWLGYVFSSKQNRAGGARCAL